MASASRTALLLASSALLAACGARSQLVAATSGGSGPTTTTTSGGGFGGAGGSGGTGDVGGSGGILDGCIVDGQPIGLAGTDAYATTSPGFARPVQVDSTTLVSAWTVLEGPKVAPVELRHSSFQAWGPWPADGTIGPSYLADYDGDQAFYAAPSVTTFGLLFRNPSPATGLNYLTQLEPGSGNLGVIESIPGTDPEPCFLEQGTNPLLHLLGFSTATGAVQQLNVGQRADMVPGGMITLNLGCAVGPVVAAAAPFGDDFLIAYSSGSAFGDPGCPSGPGIGTARRLFVTRMTKGTEVQLTDELEGTGPGDSISSIKMVPRLDGAWIVWTDTLNAGIHVVRVDPSGKSASAPVILPFFGQASSISATRLGDRLALAWSASAADAPSQIRVNVVSTAGNIDADVSINLGPPATGRTAILGSPSSTALLLSWSEETPQGPQIRLARLGCSLP